MRSIVFLIGCFSLFLHSCGESTKLKEVNVDGFAVVMVPEELSMAKNLNKDAILQLQNPKDDLYIVIVEDNKEEFKNLITEYFPEREVNISSYAELATSSIESGLKLIAGGELVRSDINGLVAYSSSYDGDLNGISVHYKIMCIEGKDRYYQIVAWTIAEKKDKHSKVIDGVFNSFKENH